MNFDLRAGMGILLAALLVLYWCLLFRMVHQVFERPRFKKMYIFPIAIVNTVGTVMLPPMIGGVGSSYAIILSLMFLEFWILYQDPLDRNIFCVSACIIHVLAIHVMVTGLFAMFTGYFAFEISTQSFWLMLSVIVTLILLNLAIVGVLKWIPFDKIRIINQRNEQQCFLVMWMTVNNAYLLYTAPGLDQLQIDSALPANQVISSLSILLGLYIVLFFAIKTITLLGYKEKIVALEQVVFQEQQYRNSVTKDAIVYYEVNVTQDTIIHGFEDKRAELGDIVDCYSDMLAFMTRKIIHSEDLPEFTKYATSQNIIREFEQGGSETTTEYRRRLGADAYVWVRAVTNLVKDMETGDLLAFVCIKNIDAEKRRQLELQHKAERDSLTGLYNKEITGKLVNEHLCSGRPIHSALFMIDVDNFKEINDHFGHVYGDAVLCELGDKLRAIFRDDDIIGRIGGDEYIAYMKNIGSEQIVDEKAAEICKAFHSIYKGTQGESYIISGSVGIAIFPMDGSNFEDLYQHADIALYRAKSKGKNNFQRYDGSDFAGYKSARTGIQGSRAVYQKSFRQNRIEYVFKMLYQSENPVVGIHSALGLVASHFSFERGYIFETGKDGKTTSNTFEWCAEGVVSQIDNLQNLPIETVRTANTHFYENGIFVLNSLDGMGPMERAILEPQGIKSMFQFGIFEKSHLLGFIGFDNCRNEMLPSDTEIDEMATICNILATFFVKQYIDEVAAKDLRARQEVMNHLDNYIYVINMKTFEVLFMNKQIQRLMNESDSSSVCYDFFRGHSEQCEDCPMRTLAGDNVDRTVVEIYNTKLGIWLEVTASTLRWTDGSLACLMNCADITKQKNEHLQHIHQLEQLAYVDELTGSRTYHKFKEDAQRILENESDRTHFLVKFDIDNFKLVNQEYGYDKGNEVLCHVARALEKTVRGENEIFARMGNDEFIALFTLQDSSAINELYDRFLGYFYALMGADFVFKCKFPHGHCVIQPDDVQTLDLNTMFERANVAHKAAKADKIRGSVGYDASMIQKALHAKEIENKMEDALDNDEFEVYLQPKYHLDTGKVGGAEALTRWKKGSAELFYPGSFIPVFERNGFITKLDFHMFRKVCAIIKDWISAGVEPVVVSVNFSRLHLGNRYFVQELCEIVDRIGIDRKYIEIEITETVIYDHIDTLVVLLQELHQGGFTMSMDDFGSGYSSLGMLKNLPVDVIKIDRSFFTKQKDEERSKIVVGSIIEMAAKLGIGIVAEGVEEQKHIDLLRELHCDMVQGYYFARPMPVGDFTKLIRASQ